MLEVFSSALAGDDARLRAEAGADGVFCVAPELSSVFLVQTDDDGGQTGTLAVVGSGGGGGVHRVEVPRAFRVREISRDGERFVLSSADGRTAHGTPAQFEVYPRLVDAEHNPRYEDQLEAIFLATHQLPVREVVLVPPRADLTLDGAEIVDVGEAMVPVGDREVLVSFDSVSPDKVVALLPHARALLASFDDVVRDGVDFLWAWGEEGDETEADKADFRADIAPIGLTVYLTGDFHVDLESVSGRNVLEGYWYAVQFTADRTPVDVSVEA